MHVPSFPPTVPRSGASLPSPRSGWARSRASTVLSRRYDFLPPISPHFVSFAWRYHTLRLGLRSHRARTQPRWTGSALGSATPRGPIETVETTGSPKFLGNPNCFYARFCDSGRTACPHCHDGAAARPPLRVRRGLLHWDFRSSISWPRSWLSTLRSVGHPTTTQDSLPGAGQALLGGLGYPQGLDERFRVVPTSQPHFKPPAIMVEAS